MASAGHAVIYHDSAGTFARKGRAYKIKRQRRYLVERNSLRTMLKNYSVQTLAWTIPARMIILFYEMLFLIATRKSGFAADLLRALKWNASNLRETLRSRQLVQRGRKQPDRVIMRRMNKSLAIVASLTILQKESSGIVWAS